MAPSGSSTPTSVILTVVAAVLAGQETDSVSEWMLEARALAESGAGDGRDAIARGARLVKRLAGAQQRGGETVPESCIERKLRVSAEWRVLHNCCGSVPLINV